jgi:diaminopimelate epimerase
MAPMNIDFTKMHGAGNDFVVLDETQGELGLNAAQYRWLADRHFGVGADQILSVRTATTPGVDFAYVIHNADGGQVEHCGNGARCFMRYVLDNGLTDQTSIKVQVQNGVIELHQDPDGRVRVDMGAPVFDAARVPFDSAGLTPEWLNGFERWTLDGEAPGACAPVGVVSMGNPHAVQWVDDLGGAPVESVGPWVESHCRFPQRVNAGFMQIFERRVVALRVYERGAGETLACGTGACAAVVAGIRWGLLDAEVDVHTHGGMLTISWDGGDASVWMTGPVATVFEGSVDVPDFSEE